MAGPRFNQRIKARKGGRFGGASNYTDFATDTGLQTMQGTAKVYRELFIPAAAFDPATSASHNMTGGSAYLNVSGAHFHTRALTPTADNAVAWAECQLIAPQDACTSGSVIPYLEVTPTTVIAAGSDMAKPTLKYGYVNENAGSSTSGSVALATAASVVAAIGTRQKFTLPAIPSFTPGQLMRFQVEFPATGASTNSASRLGLVGLRLRYVCDRIGASGVS